MPDFRLTLEISHWCNVHKSLLQDQQETVDLALSRTDHVHARVGHAESPQITDPRAPAWEHKVAEGQPLMMTAEFWPPNFMTAVPYTCQIPASPLQICGR